MAGKWKLFQEQGTETWRNFKESSKDRSHLQGCRKTVLTEGRSKGKIVGFMQKGRRITELEGNIPGTSIAAKYRIMMSHRFWVIAMIRNMEMVIVWLQAPINQSSFSTGIRIFL